jgi:hypothetical protein
VTNNWDVPRIKTWLTIHQDNRVLDEACEIIRELLESEKIEFKPLDIQRTIQTLKRAEEDADNSSQQIGYALDRLEALR